MRRQLLLLLPILACALPAEMAMAQTPSPGCGDKIAVRRGDTLSSIAERCDISERRLIRLNPSIEGSRDLRVGMELQAGEDGARGSDTLGRLGSFAGEAVDTLSDFARDLGSSAQDILDRNPDLRKRLERFDQQLRGGGAGPGQGTVSVTPNEAPVGESLTVTAQGLPPDTPVVIGIGRPQAAYEVVEQSRTGSDGGLRMDVRIPDWAADMDRLSIAVAAENGAWTIRSQPVRVTGTKL